MQKATLKGPASPIEVYSYDQHVLNSVEESLQVTCMTIDDWHQAQWADPVLGLMIASPWGRTLGQHQLKLTNPPEL